MNLPHLLACFFGGAFFVNAIPHFVSGVLGKPFQSPFAKPPGEGLSSSTVNLLWGSFNFLICYGLWNYSDFDLRIHLDALAFGLGVLVLGLFTARHFGRFHGGNAP